MHLKEHSEQWMKRRLTEMNVNDESVIKTKLQILLYKAKSSNPDTVTRLRKASE